MYTIYKGEDYQKYGVNMPDRKQNPLRVDRIEPQQCSDDRRLEVLSRTPFFAGLNRAELTRINGFFQEEGYEAGETIYFTGDPARRLYVVAAGKVKVTRHSLSGQDVVLAILTPGDFFGSLSILGDAAYADTVQAQTQVCVLGVDAQAFQTILLNHPAAAVAALQETAQRLQAAHETIRQLSALPVERRIAAILLALGHKLGEKSSEGLLLQVPLSRQELADMAGATVETASRVISKLEQGGMVRSGRQWIAITDSERLAALAQES